MTLMDFTKPVAADRVRLYQTFKGLCFPLRLQAVLKSCKVAFAAL